MKTYLIRSRCFPHKYEVLLSTKLETYDLQTKKENIDKNVEQ